MMIMVLSGCWSSRELDELAVVMGIGIDKSGDHLECCTQVIVPQNVGSGEEGGAHGEKPYTNFITEGKELSTCISKVSDTTGKYVFMSHNLIAVLDEDAASDGIYKYLDYLMRDNQLRLSVCLFVTDKSPEEVFNAEAPLFEIPSINLSKISEGFPESLSGQNVTVLDFINNMMCKKKGSLVPFITLVDGKIKVCGSAVFNGDKMTGRLDEEDLKGVLWIIGDLKGGDIVLDINNNTLSLRIGRIKSKTFPVLDKNGEIYIKAEIRGDLYLVSDDANMINTIGMDAVVEKLNQSVEKEILTSLSKTKKMGVDIYGFGDMIYRKNPAVWRAIENTWENRFKEIRVDISADFSIIETGSIIGSVKK